MVGEPHHCGYVALAGRPNVGKSTLFNRLAGAKLAAVTAKPQTTRNRVLAIRTTPRYQMVLVDTPGFHEARSPMNIRMVESACRATDEADVTILIIDGLAGIAGADRDLADRLARKAQAAKRVATAVNKIDLLDWRLLPNLLEAAALLVGGAEVVPISALSGENVPELERVIVGLLPDGPSLYPGEQLSDQSERFWAQEVIREKLMATTRQELPYEVAVMVDSYREEPERNLIIISATILVSRPGQKRIVIGQRGQQIREVGKQARQELETQLGRRVFLDLYVKVHRHWSRDPQVLRELGL